MEIICSWRTLFRYAGALGKARIAYRNEPTEANASALADALKSHDDYAEMCVKADRMFHFPDISPAALRQIRPAP